MKRCTLTSRINVISTGVLVFAVLSASVQAANEPLSLNKAISTALAADVWHQGNQLKAEAFRDEGDAASALPDPKLSLSANNLPIDNLGLEQEGMTQLKLGLSQSFPRGDTLDLNQRKGQQRALLTDISAETRKAQVSLTVGQLYLDAWLFQHVASLIQQNRYLFEQLVQITEKNYEAAWGKAQQQDVIRAELELSRLDERLSQVWQNYDRSYQQLAEWLPPEAHYSQLLVHLPELEPLKEIKAGDWQSLSQVLMKHPTIKGIEQQKVIANTEVDIAKQSYKSAWSVTASYGYRDSDPLGNSRSDLFSVGVTLDLPIFTNNRQDKKVSAATYRAEAIETDKQLLLRQLRAQFEATKAQLSRLAERQQRYQTQLIKQTQQQAEAALNAYTADSGDFAEVMRAHIAVLNTRIEATQIQVERLKKIVQLNYLLVGEVI